jgi:protoheme IX farnesyltransferase
MRFYWRLIRPGLLVMVLFSMAMAALATGPRVLPWSELAHSLFGTGILIAGAGAINQLLERQSDARMTRTAGRPLPAEGLTARQVIVFAVLSSVLGMVDLAVFAKPAVTLLAALSWIIYVLIYTPSKRVTVWQTPIGAVAGALPMLLGTAAAGALRSPWSPVLFGIVFFWQFPHTMAIAWIYRRQYEAGAVKVATVVEPCGRLAGGWAFLGAAGLLLASLVPPVLSLAGWTFAVPAVALGVTHLAYAARFRRRPDDASASALWKVSLVHLPVLLAALLVDLRC